MFSQKAAIISQELLSRLQTSSFMGHFFKFSWKAKKHFQIRFWKAQASTFLVQTYVSYKIINFYIAGELLQATDFDGSFFSTVQVTSSGTKIRYRADHTTGKSEWIIRKDLLRCAVIVLKKFTFFNWLKIALLFSFSFFFFFACCFACSLGIV